MTKRTAAPGPADQLVWFIVQWHSSSSGLLGRKQHTATAILFPHTAAPGGRKERGGSQKHTKKRTEMEVGTYRLDESRRKRCMTSTNWRPSERWRWTRTPDNKVQVRTRKSEESPLKGVCVSHGNHLDHRHLDHEIHLHPSSLFTLQKNTSHKSNYFFFTIFNFHFNK